MREALVEFLEENYGGLDLFPERDLTVYGGMRLDGVKVVGNDECFDGNEFFQYILDGDTLYKAYYDIDDGKGGLIPLDSVDYGFAYRIEEVQGYEI